MTLKKVERAIHLMKWTRITQKPITFEFSFAYISLYRYSIASTTRRKSSEFTGDILPFNKVHKIHQRRQHFISLFDEAFKLLSNKTLA